MIHPRHTTVGIGLLSLFGGVVSVLGLCMPWIRASIGCRDIVNPPAVSITGLSLLHNGSALRFEVAAWCVVWGVATLVLGGVLAIWRSVDVPPTRLLAGLMSMGALTIGAAALSSVLPTSTHVVSSLCSGVVTRGPGQYLCAAGALVAVIGSVRALNPGDAVARADGDGDRAAHDVHARA